jgi:thiamine biosynthesis lipoprotein
MDRRGFLALGAGALAVAAAPPLLRPGERLVRLTVPVMGTIGELAVPARHEGAARQAMGAAAAELRRIESLMTRFSPDSDVGRFNAAREGALVPVSPETAEVVRAALGWARESDGVFDPCLGGLSELWDPGWTTTEFPRGELPAPERVAALADRRLWQAVEPGGTPSAPVLRKLDADARLDLGGIAKGYGVDRAAAVLAGSGVFRGLVNVGGDLMALGDGPGGRPWKVGVRDPRAPEHLTTTLEVVETAVATSGDYLRGFVARGERWHHLLNPETGRPRRGAFRTVTLTAPTVAEADAGATTAFGLHPDDLTTKLVSLSPRLRVRHTG